MVHADELTSGSASVERDGLMFDVLDEGPLDGEPVVLLHGFPERSDLLAPRRAAPARAPATGPSRWTSAATRRAPGPKRRRDYRHAGPRRGRRRADRRDRRAACTWSATTGARPSAWTVAMPATPTWCARSPRSRCRTPRRSCAPLVTSSTSSEVATTWRSVPAAVPARSCIAGVAGGWFDTAAAQGRDDRATTSPGSGARSSTTARCTRRWCWYRAVPLTDPRGAARFRVSRADHDGVEHQRRRARSLRRRAQTADYVDGPYELVVLDGVTHWVPTQAPEALGGRDPRAGRVG